MSHVINKIGEIYNNESMRVSLPANMECEKQGPGFIFKEGNIHRQSIELYQCENVVISWNWKNGSCIYDINGNVVLDLEDYWHEKPNYIKPNIKKIQGNTLSLIQFKARKNYAHFMLECLTKLFYFREEVGIDDFDSYLVDKYSMPAFSELSKILNLKGSPVCLEKNGALECSNLFVTSGLHHPMNRVEPILHGRWQEITNRVLPRSLKFKRIFIDREQGNRGIINSEEVDSILEKYEFEKVSFDNIGILEQMKIINGSNIIAGIHGAAFANLIFADSVEKISCIEVMPHSFGMQSYWLLSNGLGMNYCAVAPVGGWGNQKIPASKYDDILVDIIDLENSIINSIVFCK